VKQNPKQAEQTILRDILLDCNFTFHNLNNWMNLQFLDTLMPLSKDKDKVSKEKEKG